jgi:outer membrane protein assembly factor BamD (BamD/ComL family)
VESPAPGDLRDRGPENLGPGDYPGRAREEFEAGRVASAISLLDQFRARYPSGSDEAWWLYGQFYEANSPSRDIRTALDYYRRLVREYPQSPRYNDARRRIAYLERYYINIR